MAFCGNCGTKAVGSFCINCGKPTQLIVEPTKPAAPLQAVEPISEPEPQFNPEPSRAEPLASAEPEVSDSREPTESEDPAPRSKTSKRLAVIIAGSVVLLGALLFPGSGELTVVYHDNTSEANAAVDLTLQMDERNIRISPDSDGEVVYTSSWSSFAASEIRIVPDPKNDEVITLSLPQLGSLGIWNINRPRVVTITANDGSLEVNLSGGDNFSEVGTMEAFRTFYFKDLASCKGDFDDDYGYAIKLRQNANENYLGLVKDAQLNGMRTLYYPTWAFRADNLQDKMSNYLSLITSNSLPDENSLLQSAGVEVQAAFIDLRSAWENLETVSRNESVSKWDGAWDKIYNAESALASKVNLFIPYASDAGKDFCSARLNRE